VMVVMNAERKKMRAWLKESRRAELSGPLRKSPAQRRGRLR
jgi:hypothetical protein